MTVVRSTKLLIAAAALAVTATACPIDPPSEPAPAGPTPATVVAITPGGNGFSNRPMSTDGRYVGYSRYNPDTFGTEPYLWDRTTGASTPLFGGPQQINAVDPVLTADGTAAFYSTWQVAEDQAPVYDASLLRVDTATGNIDQFPLPDAGVFPGARQVRGIASSADGSVVALEVSDNGVPFLRREVQVWTEAGGFDTITDHAAIESDDVYGYELPGAGISPDGRFVAVVTLDRLDDTGTRMEHLDVFDRTTRTWTRAWTSDVITRPDISDMVTVLATLDDGSLVFDVTDPGNAGAFMVSHGVRLWDAATSTTSQLIADDPAAQGWSASPDGRFVGYTGSDRSGPPSNASFGTPHLLDRQTGAVLPAGSRPLTLPVGIGMGGQRVLLFSYDPALNQNPAAGNGLFLWNRG